MHARDDAHCHRRVHDGLHRARRLRQQHRQSDPQKQEAVYGFPGVGGGGNALLFDLHAHVSVDTHIPLLRRRFPQNIAVLAGGGGGVALRFYSGDDGGVLLVFVVFRAWVGGGDASSCFLCLCAYYVCGFEVSYVGGYTTLYV